ncbi:diiron oxygenase [Aquimarina aquimarini]|uniref:diiron oxygenase n=1 Tax=Aquimarina aquimarini TaxID=1191734 RepID=UPI000D5514BE|nr:diiron oxygenase [Aquimarina aquimarini]
MSRPTKEYISRFKQWQDTAIVHLNTHPTLQDFEEGLDFYSRELSLLLKHPKVASLPKEKIDSLLVLELYNYLEFTVWLELGPVNEVCNLIRMPSFLPWLSKEMKDDALKIYVDEGAHAEMAFSLISKIEDYTNIKSLRLEPMFLKELDAIILNQPKELEKMIKVFFVIISETLITGTLTGLPNDENVQKGIREFALDHATDEGKHHAYFKHFFEILWPKMPRELQITIGEQLPKMMLGFLNPDAHVLKQVLLQFFSEEESEEILDDLLSSEEIIEGVRKSSFPTKNMLKKSKLFEIKEIENAFSNHQLLKVPV